MHYYDTAVIAQGQMALANPSAVHRFDTAHSIDVPRMLFDWVTDLCGQDEFTLIVHDVPGRQGRFGVTSAFRDMATQLAVAGWATPDIGRSMNTGWSTWTRLTPEIGTTETVHLGILPMLDYSRTPLFRAADSAERIAYNLQAYREATGGTWRQTAGVSGCAAIRSMNRAAQDAREAMLRQAGKKAYRSEPRWRWDDRPTGYTLKGDFLTAAGDLRYSRPVEHFLGPRSTGIVAHLDIRSMYLAAASIANMPYGIPQQGPRPFDRNTAGYWRISLNDNDLPREIRPWVLDVTDAVQDGIWVTTPIMTYLNDKGINPHVTDAYTALTSSRVLRPWAERLTAGRPGLAHAHPDVAKAWKRTYTETVGMLSAVGGSICRPDWRDMIIDTARVNLVRKLEAVYKVVGIWPFRVYTDGVWYHLPYDTDIPVSVLGALGVIGDDGELDGRPGKFRVVSVEPAGDAYTRMKDEAF